MPELNYLALAVATLAAFVISTAWYTVFGTQLATQRTAGAGGTDARASDAAPALWKIGVELLRSLIVATTLAYAAAHLGIVGLSGAVALGATAFVAFPLVLLVGSVIWEDVPVGLAAIHAGDWLVKLVVLAVIVALWR